MSRPELSQVSPCIGITLRAEGLYDSILPGNGIDTTNAFLDVSLPKGGMKIDPETKEFTDSEISPLGARGKPPTVSWISCIGIVYR